MTDLNLGIIYSIKHFNEGETCKERIKNFLYEYTDTPKEYPYSDTELYRILVETVKSYMEAAESPRWDMYNFFDCLRVTNPLIGNPEEQRIVREYVMNAMIGMLGMARVKRDGEYVNGFREMRKEY